MRYGPNMFQTISIKLLMRSCLNRQRINILTHASCYHFCFIKNQRSYQRRHSIFRIFSYTRTHHRTVNIPRSIFQGRKFLIECGQRVRPRLDHLGRYFNFTLIQRWPVVHKMPRSNLVRQPDTSRLLTLCPPSAATPDHPAFRERDAPAQQFSFGHRERPVHRR